MRSANSGPDGEYGLGLGDAETKFPEIPRPRMAEHANTSGLLYYAPIEGNQSYDHMLPSSSGKLHGIELLDPAVGMAAGFRSTRGRKEAPQLEH